MRLLKFCGSLLFFTSVHLLAGAAPNSNEQIKILDRTLDSAVIENVKVVTKGGRSQSVTNRYTQLGAGLHRMDNGKLVEADATLELHPDGAIGKDTGHKVKFSANINNWNGAIDLTAPDDKRFLSRPALISYFDPGTGESVMVAELKDSVGVLFPPSKIVYENAFTDFKADLEYNNLLSGLQQNLIFRERPPEPSEFGLTNPGVMIQILTEFFNSPVPAKKTEVREGVEDDRQLNFGAMKIGVGKSFVIGEDKRSWSVQKKWINLQGRTFLVEQVPYARIAAQLNALPLPAQANNGKLKAVRHVASKKRLLPERQVATLKSAREIQVASVPLDQNGFVIDYSLVAGELTNFVFKADTTYEITNRVDLYGTTVFEGGTVLKYRDEATLVVYDQISCQTDSYRPAVFTSWKDDSIGGMIAGSTGIPSLSAWYALGLMTGTNTELKHLRVSYADQGVIFDVASGSVSDCQFLKCTIGLASQGGELWLRNNLFYQCETALGVLGVTIHGEHLTVNQSRDLVYEEWNMQVRLTNTLLVAVTNLGLSDINATNSNFIWFTNDPGIFQIVGAGRHYLATNSPYRNVGITNVSAEVLDGLAESTTFPPVLLASNITVNTTLSPVVERDTSLPDLGYHYPPLDYVLGTSRITGATVNLVGGPAVGFYALDGWGACVLECGAEFISVGAPQELNKLVWYNTVQEQADSAWTATGWSIIDIFSFENYSCPGVTSVSLDCRFTQFSRMADNYALIGGGDYGWEGTIRLQDCVFSTGFVVLWSPGGWNGMGGMDATVTNCLFLRSALYYQSGGELFEVDTVNNLFYGGPVSLSANSISGTEFVRYNFRNNFFFTNAFTVSGLMNLTHSHNAYITNAPSFTRLGTLATGDVILTNVPAFERGELGDFYLPTNSLLFNAGTTNAHLLGLYHFTTTTNQVKETNSFVDIGYHYVAVNNHGNAMDTDDDGIPDYLEDANGNGNVDVGETEWDFGLEIWITAPKANSNLP